VGWSSSPFGLLPSQIIFAPMAASSTKAIQWSHASMAPAKATPSDQPINGAIACAAPKARATVRAVRHGFAPATAPWLSETANASAARPKARRMREIDMAGA
jgi:hypothetical protein